jgi:hypothetical protein
MKDPGMSRDHDLNAFGLNGQCGRKNPGVRIWPEVTRRYQGCVEAERVGSTYELGCEEESGIPFRAKFTGLQFRNGVGHARLAADGVGQGRPNA